MQCPGQVNGAGLGPKCVGAKQPSKQTCDADNPRDDDCNGSNDDPTGANLLEKTTLRHHPGRVPHRRGHRLRPQRAERLRQRARLPG